MHHRDRSFNLDQMKQTAINFHIDDLSRKSSAPFISGRGVAMAAASSSDQCHHCQASGHFIRDCPKLSQMNRSNRGKKKDKKSKSGDPSPKWWSYHKTATQSDAQCHKQTELQQLGANLALLRSSEQRFANIGRAFLAQTPQPGPQPDLQAFEFSFSAVVLPWLRRPRQLQPRRRLLPNKLANQQLRRLQPSNLDHLLRSLVSGTTASSKGLSVRSWQLPPPRRRQAPPLTKRSSR